MVRLLLGLTLGGSGKRERRKESASSRGLMSCAAHPIWQSRVSHPMQILYCVGGIDWLEIKVPST